ncbi:MAG: peptidoglycan-binding protein [Candidatus Omnitrophica bacterium]|nr:peptidoglycan-binding protein [Candidatus Omnitrophota bacterium]
MEDFQKANNLKVDGKVGPKTWAVLSKYLNPPAQAESVKKP